MMDQGKLFGESAEAEQIATKRQVRGSGVPRLRIAVRDQVVLRMLPLDQMLPQDHEARMVWEFVCRADLSVLRQEVRAVERGPGRDHTDPRILLAVWLYATSKGVGSARELARLCGATGAIPYQWLCGEVSLNYHLLSDFRTKQGAILDRLLTEQIATLMHAGVVTVERVAQDGVRVRASAGSSSFRRRQTLEQCLAEAQAQVEALQAEQAADPAAGTRRQKAARTRAAQERSQRVAAALEALKEVQAKKEQRGRDSLKYPPRASTTDADARKMKMADGGFRPAYNVQFATDTASQVIVGVDVIAEGSDAGQLGPMQTQIQARTGRRPQAHLGDGGFSTLEEINALNRSEEGQTLYVPVKDEEKKQQQGQDPFAARPTDTPHVAEWRTRMGTAEAKQIYKQRAATAECVNAQARNRGMQQFRVRGLAKIRVIALWYAIAHNLLRMVALCAEVGAAD
jgi:transposase